MSDTQPERPEHLTPRDAATILRVHPTTVRRHARTLGVKVLGRWRLDPDMVAAAGTGKAAR